MTPVLGGGLWLWYWLGARKVTPDELAAEARAVGAAGVIVHAVGTAAPQLRWLDAARGALAGLDTCVAIGSRGPGKWDTALANPAVNALLAGRRVMLDAEGAWDPAPAGRLAAAKLVATVLAAVPDAVGRVADCAWWKPSVHSGFPVKEFGRLCATRYPQCYPEVAAATGRQRDGGAAACLARARAEYPPRGSPAAAVYPTVRGYVRTSADACTLALAEPHQLLWLGSAHPANRLAPEVARGLKAAAKIRAAGFATVSAYQAAHDLVADGVCGPRTLASLGLTLT